MIDNQENKIETSTNPLNNSDWSAARRDWDLGDLIGYGRTEQEAIDNLLELEADARD